MACPLPFRPWFYPGPRVYGFRTTRDQSTNPTHVLSCTSAPPQWMALPLVALPGRRGRPCLPSQAPRIDPRPFSITRSKNPFLRLAFDQAFGRLCLAARRPRLQCLATLLTVSALRPSEACFSSPRSWASLFKAYFRFRGRHPVSRMSSAPALSCQTARLGTGAPAASAREISGTPRLPTFFRWEWGPCPHELEHLPGFLPPDIGRGFFPHPAPPALSIPTSEDAGTRGPRGSLPAARRFPLFRGR